MEKQQVWTRVQVSLSGLGSRIIGFARSLGSIVKQLLVGGSLGFFVGVLIALATQTNSVISAVTTSAMALVTAYGTITYVPKLAPSTEPSTIATTGSRANAWVIVGFGLFSTAGVLFGIYIRTHQTLSPTPQEEVNKWRKAGFSKHQSLCLVAASFGFELPHESGLSAGSDSSSASKVLNNCLGPNNATNTQERHAETTAGPPIIGTVLLNSEIGACEELDGVTFASMRDADESLRPRGGNWAQLVSEAQALKIPEIDQLQALSRNIHRLCTQMVP